MRIMINTYKSFAMRFIFIFYFCLFLSIGYGQNVTYEWAVNFGSTQMDRGTIIDLDNNGNVIIGGYYEADLDIDPSSNNFFLEHTEDKDCFLVKLNSAGELIWGFGLAGSDDNQFSAICTDELGNIFVTGYHYGSIDLDPGEESLVFNSNGQSDMFVCKYDPDGNLIWGTSFGNEKYSFFTDIDLDEDGNLLLMGSFSKKLDFDPGQDTLYLETVDRGFDAFVLKLTSQGAFVWVKQLGSNGPDSGTSLSIDSNGDLIVSGKFMYQIDLDPSPDSLMIQSNGEEDIFLCKLDALGNLIWGYGIGGENDDFIAASTLDDDDNIYLTGSYSYQTNLGTNDNEHIISSPAHTGFIAKYDNHGKIVWGRNISEGGRVLLGKVQIADDGNIFGCGRLDDDADLDPSEAEYILSAEGGVEDIIIVCLGLDSELIWAKSLGKQYQESASQLVVDDFGSVITTGHFQGNMDFDPGEGVEKILGSGYWDAFVQKMTPCYEYIDYSVTHCDSSLVAPNGDVVWDESGMYFDTIIEPHHCNEYYKIDFSNIVTEDSIIAYEDSLVAVQDGANYQWIHSFDGERYNILEGANEQSFVIDTMGYYSAIIDNFGCIDTTNFIYYDSLFFIIPQIDQIQFVAYPNPSRGHVEIDLGQNYSKVTVIVYNSAGLEIQKIDYQQISKVSLELKETGLYFLEVLIDKENSFVQKLLIRKE